MLSKVCGTPDYTVPEMIQKKKYGFSVDMWFVRSNRQIFLNCIPESIVLFVLKRSFGVILFILLSGYPPFQDDDEAALYEKICAEYYSFHDDVIADCLY